MCVARMGARRNAVRIFARRDMQKAYGNEMWVENLRWIVLPCMTRGIPRRVREDDIKRDFEGPGCEDMHIV